MGILIDSSVLIEFERSDKDVAAYVSGREDEDVFISVVSASELLHRALACAALGGDYSCRYDDRHSRFVVGRDMHCTWPSLGHWEPERV